MKGLSLRLYESWMKRDPELTKKVMSQEYCDIEPEFMCFTDMYYHLAQMIPKHWTIVDLGCSFAPQCLYFKDHKKYVGVDAGDLHRFTTKNSEIVTSTIKNWIKNTKVWALDLDESFAIMSYVPCSDYDYFLAKNLFKNMFFYYPHGSPAKKMIRTDKKRSKCRIM